MECTFQKKWETYSYLISKKHIQYVIHHRERISCLVISVEKRMAWWREKGEMCLGLSSDMVILSGWEVGRSILCRESNAHPSECTPSSAEPCAEIGGVFEGADSWREKGKFLGLPGISQAQDGWLDFLPVLSRLWQKCSGQQEDSVISPQWTQKEEANSVAFTYIQTRSSEPSRPGSRSSILGQHLLCVAQEDTGQQLERGGQRGQRRQGGGWGNKRM